MAKLDIVFSSRREALGQLVELGVEPYCRSTTGEATRILFRKVAGTQRIDKVRRQRKNPVWTKLIEALNMRTSEDVTRIRQEVRRQLTERQ